MKRNGARVWPKAGAMLAACVLVSVVGMTSSLTRGEPAPVAAKEYSPKVGDAVKIFFRKGDSVDGVITALSATHVKAKFKIAGIESENEWPMSEVSSITPNGASVASASPATAPEPTATPDAASPAATPDDTAAGESDGKTRVYWTDLTGEFGVDITQTPIRNAIRDANKNNADVLIFHVDADWGEKFDRLRESTNDMASFDQLFRAESITPIFTTEMPTEWKKMPKVVFWVKQAMGGAAFLPVISPDIYFSSDGRLGGMGNLSTMLQGHERVVEKQISLRLQHAVGWVNAGGFPQPEELVRGMAKIEAVISVRFENGRPVLVERLPNGPDEELLTDSGEGAYADSLEDRAAGSGNDVLTLSARTAKLIGFSKGTVDSREELLAALGLERSAVFVDKRSANIQNEWKKGLTNGKRQITKAIQDYRDVRVAAPGGRNEQIAALSTRIRKLEDVLSLTKRWAEGLSGRWLFENGVPREAELLTQIEVLKAELRRLR